MSVGLGGCILEDIAKYVGDFFGDPNRNNVDPNVLAIYFDGPKVRPGVALDITVTAVGAGGATHKQYFVDADGFISMELLGQVKCDGLKLVTLQKKAFEYLELLDTGKYTHDQLTDMIRFVQQDLCCRKADIKELEDADLVIYLRKKLNRPMRVCGVVKNVGEPGGGPFLTYNQDGTVSLQILESSQIDKSNKEYMEMFTKGTHFNPVDLVCAVKDYKGNAFDLPKFVDQTTGFISQKSKSGKELQALELPGLWNGAMSDWSTIFVEVPLSTFNPVKTVNDLLREQHQ